ncbi:hypothetical protein OF83DRAFT_167254 [Amylostereum chailletii]|nr:hypothetical protein OF83DRAFT_167254 [Amylostereum chailletii]
MDIAGSFLATLVVGAGMGMGAFALTRRIAPLPRSTRQPLPAQSTLSTPPQDNDDEIADPEPGTTKRKLASGSMNDAYATPSRGETRKRFKPTVASLCLPEPAISDDAAQSHLHARARNSQPTSSPAHASQLLTPPFTDGHISESSTPAARTPFESSRLSSSNQLEYDGQSLRHPTSSPGLWASATGISRKRKNRADSIVDERTTISESDESDSEDGRRNKRFKYSPPSTRHSYSHVGSPSPSYCPPSPTFFPRINDVGVGQLHQRAMPRFGFSPRASRAAHSPIAGSSNAPFAQAPYGTNVSTRHTPYSWSINPPFPLRLDLPNLQSAESFSYPLGYPYSLRPTTPTFGAVSLGQTASYSLPRPTPPTETSIFPAMHSLGPASALDTFRIYSPTNVADQYYTDGQGSSTSLPALSSLNLPRPTPTPEYHHAPLVDHGTTECIDQFSFAESRSSRPEDHLSPTPYATPYYTYAPVRAPSPRWVEDSFGARFPMHPEGVQLKLPPPMLSEQMQPTSPIFGFSSPPVVSGTLESPLGLHPASSSPIGTASAGTPSHSSGHASLRPVQASDHVDWIGDHDSDMTFHDGSDRSSFDDMNVAPYPSSSSGSSSGFQPSSAPSTTGPPAVASQGQENGAADRVNAWLQTQQLLGVEVSDEVLQLRWEQEEYFEANHTAISTVAGTESECITVAETEDEEVDELMSDEEEEQEVDQGTPPAAYVPPTLPVLPPPPRIIRRV